ncbi:hypothetical protein AVEN_32469-1 [Araneus ventricosus]|uniref:Uncharacterized protein n=1 Tax=Araneus ventricosus TaxID=182803 RepID=A0A4Y2ESS5_ARAVE|nr:hypothetical protein AVEN_32469-1 [Araneus ventricosus]
MSEVQQNCGVCSGEVSGLNYNGVCPEIRTLKTLNVRNKALNEKLVLWVSIEHESACLKNVIKVIIHRLSGDRIKPSSRYHRPETPKLNNSLPVSER